jgi:hypothetical protein
VPTTLHYVRVAHYDPIANAAQRRGRYVAKWKAYIELYQFDAWLGFLDTATCRERVLSGSESNVSVVNCRLTELLGSSYSALSARRWLGS